MVLPQRNGIRGSNRVNEDSSNYQAVSVVSRRGGFGRFYVLVLLFVLCTLFYYFGELVDLAGWKALRWEFLYTVHDVHRLLFLVPIVYAGYFFGVRAAIVTTIVAFNTFLYRALFISPFPDPLVRVVLFIILAGAVGYLTGRESERRRHLEIVVKSQGERIRGIFEGIEEGVLIVGSDYKIRFINPSMLKDFGEGIGVQCYKYLHKLNAPCPQICRLPTVVSGAAERWEYTFPDGRTYEVLASPYTDSDGTACQLAIFKRLSGA